MTQLRPGPAYTLPEILPHGPGMLLLDRLVGYEADALTCELTIRPDSRFCDGRAVPAWVGLEYMAQALGAYTGIARLQQGRPVQIEMLLGTRAYDCAVPAFPVGSRLTVRVKLLFWDPDGVCAFACEVRDGDAVLATSQVKGYEPDDIEPFLQSLTQGTP
jgi:predicted hotdog family 3-hydroxylacyl-ACP dehydratase